MKNIQNARVSYKLFPARYLFMLKNMNSLHKKNVDWEVPVAYDYKQHLLVSGAMKLFLQSEKREHLIQKSTLSNVLSPKLCNALIHKALCDTLKHKYLSFFMWLFPLSFFTYQFILRLWPGLMIDQIMEQFSIDASHFGMLAAFYYYGYAGMQIPIAILSDNFNIKYTVFGLAVMCGLAMLMFTYTNNFYLAILSRFLIGAGSAAGFLCVSKVVSEWFLKEHYARIISFSFTIGLVGAIYGGKPVGLLIEKYNWQNIAEILAVISIIIGFSSYLILRSPKSVGTVKDIQQFKMADFSVIFSSPIIWLLAVSNLLMVGSLEGFADVWGISYLTTTYNLNKGDAAGFISFIFIGMLFGGPLLAFFSKKFGNYPVIIACGLGIALTFILLLSTYFNVGWILSCLFFCIGIMCCYQVIIFSAGSNLVLSEHLGITIAFLNCINMLGGSFFHTMIGTIMDIFWTGVIGEDGMRQYSPEVYRYALSIIPICAVIGAMIAGIVGNSVKHKLIGDEECWKLKAF